MRKHVRTPLSECEDELMITIIYLYTKRAWKLIERRRRTTTFDGGGGGGDEITEMNKNG